MIKILNNDVLKKHFFRFIKENDIYKRCKDISSINMYDVFDNKIRWGLSKEGFFFWKFIQTQYILELINLWGCNDIHSVNFELGDLESYFSNLKRGYGGNACEEGSMDDFYKRKIENLFLLYYVH